MKGFRYIIAMMLSLLIVFAGVGVSVMQCYCCSCRTTGICCENSHDECRPSTRQGDFSAKNSCCTTTVYKIDLSKGVEEFPYITPCVQELHRPWEGLSAYLPVEILLTDPTVSPPFYLEPKEYLALYSVLII